MPRAKLLVLSSLNKFKPHKAEVYLWLMFILKLARRGRPEGTHIDDYAVEDHADHVLGAFKTQHEAIAWAKRQGHHPLVARVRHLNNKKIPDHWQAA